MEILSLKKFIELNDVEGIKKAIQSGVPASAKYKHNNTALHLGTFSFPFFVEYNASF
jgi:hypothetical protein